MTFDEIETSPFFEKSPTFSYEKDGWVEYYPVVDEGQEMLVERDGQQYLVLEVSHSNNPKNWRKGRVVITTMDNDEGCVEFMPEDNITFAIYSRTLEAVL